MDSSDSDERIVNEESMFLELFGDVPNESPQTSSRSSVSTTPALTPSQSRAELSKRERRSLSRSLGGSASGSSGTQSPSVKIELLPVPQTPAQMVNQGEAWIAELLKQMKVFAELPAHDPADLGAATEEARRDTAAHQKALRWRRIRTSASAAMIMYWLTFGLGKVVGNSYGAIVVVCGLPAAAVYAPLFTVLGVPFMQVLFGEPYGASWRSEGVSYGSPDQGAYINHQTAHALYIRAWLEGNPADQEHYRKIMNRIVDELIQRERGKKADGSDRIPKWLRSNARMPERDDDGRVKAGETDPTSAVVGAARARSFITDEVPVHTFTVLNGMSGAASLFWKLGMGSALTRVPDMVAHTVLGSLAMVSMFEWQNVWRAKYQGVDLSDGGHPALLKAKRETARLTLAMWRQRCTEALKLVGQVDDVLKRVKNYFDSHDHNDRHWSDMLSYQLTLIAAQRQLRQSLKSLLAAARRSKRELDQLDTRQRRADKAARRIMSSMVGESPGSEPWLDGAPLRIRSIARVLGYMTVLAASTTQAILLGKSLMEYEQRSSEARTLAELNNTTLISEPLNAIGLTSEQMFVASFTASTVAANAIVGWTAKTLYGLPLWEHGIHGVAGIATRAIKGVRKCLGMSAEAAPHTPVSREEPDDIEPAEGPAYHSADEDFEMGPLGSPGRSRSSTSSSSSSSSSSDH